MTRPNDDGVGARDANPDRTFENQHRNSTSDDAGSKAFVTMQARAALCGGTLHELACGGFLLCRWGMSKELPCLRAVGDLLRRIGGAA